MKFTVTLCLVGLLLFGCHNDQSKNQINTDLSVKKTTIDTTIAHTALFNTIKHLDSLFFDVAYNRCDTVAGRKLVSKDFEFYHDKGGALLDEPNELAADIMVADFNWICNNTHRKLVADNMEVYPLHENNTLYGAVQTGFHDFYNVENNKPTQLKTHAKFIHLWILEGDDWKLKRVISYDHQPAQKN